eukprot:GEMP01134748.1.p1 GENE.GEMP01134748.1~~GEMP01134748.1.p1  ORF type:complete len:102 (+),score=2.91 GEMP01134748.1:77-382(+)
MANYKLPFVLIFFGCENTTICVAFVIPYHVFIAPMFSYLYSHHAFAFCEFCCLLGTGDKSLVQEFVHRRKVDVPPLHDEDVGNHMYSTNLKKSYQRKKHSR